MQIDWVNILSTVTVVSVVVSAVLGAGSALAYKIIQVRERVRQGRSSGSARSTSLRS
jgi:hypothetical protein